jgi:hypothetical protein
MLAYFVLFGEKFKPFYMKDEILRLRPEVGLF